MATHGPGKLAEASMPPEAQGTTSADVAPQSHARRQRRGFETAANAVFWLTVYLSLIYLFVKLYSQETAAAPGSDESIDFVAIWGAAKLALAGEAVSAFDPAVLAETVGQQGQRWFYPPTFLLLAAPLGAFSLPVAWAAFAVISALCLALALRAPAAPVPGGWRLLAVSPVVVVGCLHIGQTSVLWTAALVAALWAMRCDRAVAAGACIAVLTFKPQLGILIPFALVAGGHWRVAGWAIFWSIAFALVATVPFGPEYWERFVAGLAAAREGMESTMFSLPRMTSVYGGARTLGAGDQAALGLQAFAAVAVAGATAWVWSRARVGFDLKCAALCAGIPLATPYMFYYDMVVTLAAMMFLMRDGFAATWPARLWLAALWLGPIPVLYAPAVLPDPPVLASVSTVGVAISMVTFAVCVTRARIGRTTLPGDRGARAA